jgi:hypothetical protein
MITAIQVTTKGVINFLEFEEKESLSVLQSAVGGYVELVGLADGLDLWVNEEGKNLGLDHNPHAQKVWERFFPVGSDYLVGDVVFTGGSDSEGEMASLDIYGEFATYLEQELGLTNY